MTTTTTTQKRVDANCRNAQKSTGPSTIRAAPAEEARRQADEAALGQRLFHDPNGPLSTYPHSHFSNLERQH
jgi:hypothetical protein